MLPLGETVWKNELSIFENVIIQRFDGKASAETQVQIMSDLVNQHS